MHLFAKLIFEDLENARNELLFLFEKLTPREWQKKIPGGHKDVRELAYHSLFDTERLAILAPIVGMHDLFPSPRKNDRYICTWEEDKPLLSSENLLVRSRYERNKLRTILALIRDSKQAKKLYKSNFQTGWHERMHFFDLSKALETYYQQTSVQDIQAFAKEFTETIDVFPFLYDIDDEKLDDLAESNQTYRQEIRLLTSGRFIDAIHRLLGSDTHLRKLKGNATTLQHIQYIHYLHNDMIEHISCLTDLKLREVIDGKPLANRLMNFARSFRSTTLLFKKISLRDSWARKAGL